MPLPVKAVNIFDNARAFLNDIPADVYSNDTLQPYLKIAYEDLRLDCEDANIPFTNRTSEIITVPAGVKSIGGNETNSPALPKDLVEVIEMYERTAGSDMDFVLMSARRFLPKTDILTAFLEVYSWQGQVIKLLGANGDIEVKIDYVGDTLSQLVDKNSLIIINNCLNAISFRTAALAARYIGEDTDRATELNSEAQRCLDLMENIDIKNQQSMPVRRRPFRAGGGRRNWRS